MQPLVSDVQVHRARNVHMRHTGALSFASSIIGGTTYWATKNKDLTMTGYVNYTVYY